MDCTQDGSEEESRDAWAPAPLRQFSSAVYRSKGSTIFLHLKNCTTHTPYLFLYRLRKVLLRYHGLGFDLCDSSKYHISADLVLSSQCFIVKCEAAIGVHG